MFFHVSETPKVQKLCNHIKEKKGNKGENNHRAIVLHSIM